MAAAIFGILFVVFGVLTACFLVKQKTEWDEYQVKDKGITLGEMPMIHKRSLDSEGIKETRKEMKSSSDWLKKFNSVMIKKQTLQREHAEKHKKLLPDLMVSGCACSFFLSAFLVSMIPESFYQWLQTFFESHFWVRVGLGIVSLFLLIISIYNIFKAHKKYKKRKRRQQ